MQWTLATSIQYIIIKYPQSIQHIIEDSQSKHFPETSQLHLELDGAFTFSYNNIYEQIHLNTMLPTQGKDITDKLKSFTINRTPFMTKYN